MKSRFLVKTAYQKKLDRKLFEAVGNGDRELGEYARPDLNNVKQLIRNGATVDHFLLLTSSGTVQRAETAALNYHNAIGIRDNVYFNLNVIHRLHSVASTYMRHMSTNGQAGELLQDLNFLLAVTH